MLTFALNLIAIAKGNIDESDVRQQLNIVENGVNEAARRYNDLHVLCDRKTQELKLKLDELETLKVTKNNSWYCEHTVQCPQK